LVTERKEIVTLEPELMSIVGVLTPLFVMKEKNIALPSLSITKFSSSPPIWEQNKLECLSLALRVRPHDWSTPPSPQIYGLP